MQLLDILQSLFGEGGPQTTNRLATAGQGPNAEDRPGYLPARRGEPPAWLRSSMGGPDDPTLSLSSHSGVQTGHGPGRGQGEAVRSPAPQPAAPQQPSGGRFGGFFQKLVDPDAEARNVTVDWLQQKGYSPEDAKLITANKPFLQQIINQHYKEQQPSEFDQRATAAQRYGLTGDQARNFTLTGDIPKPAEAKRSVQTIYENGNEQKVWFDENTGEYKPIGGAKSDLLSPEAEAQKARLAQAGRTEINNNMPGQTTETAYDKEIGTKYANRFMEFQDKGSNASRGLNTIAVMRQAMNQPGFYSGTGAQAVQYGKRLLSSLGVSDAEVNGLASMEQFSSMSKQAALDAMGGSLGNGFSNADRDFVTGQVAALDTSEPGNRALLDIQEKVLKRQQEIAKMAGDYANKHGGRIDAGFDSLLIDWSEKNPLFPDSGKQPWYRRDDQGPTRIRNPEQPAQKWRATNPDTGQAIERNGNAWVPAQ